VRDTAAVAVPWAMARSWPAAKFTVTWEICLAFTMFPACTTAANTGSTNCRAGAASVRRTITS
jgi:hypothetical protein